MLNPFTTSANEGLSAVVELDFLGKHERRRLTLRRGKWSEELELVLPAERPIYSVTLEWHMKDGSRPKRGPWDEESGVVYVDEVPTVDDRPGDPAEGGL